MLQVDSITSRGHHAGPHVLDDEIAPLRHAARERHARRLLEIDGDAIF